MAEFIMFISYSVHPGGYWEKSTIYTLVKTMKEMDEPLKKYGVTKMRYVLKQITPSATHTQRRRHTFRNRRRYLLWFHDHRALGIPTTRGETERKEQIVILTYDCSILSDYNYTQTPKCIHMREKRITWGRLRNIRHSILISYQGEQSFIKSIQHEP